MKKPNNLVPYLSWTRVDLIERNPRGYLNSYLNGEKIKTRGMDFGSLVTDALERRDKDPDEVIQAVRALVPKYPQNNHKATTAIKIDGKTVQVVAYLDGWDPKKFRVGEYKTSLYPWSRSKAMEHGQMHLYPWIKWKETGRIPECELTWLETERDDDGEYYLTGNFLTHQFQLTTKDMLRMSGRLARAYKKIERTIEAELKV